MSKIVKVPLSNQGISDFIKKLRTLKKDMVTAKNKVQEDLIEIGYKEINNNISSSEYINSEPSTSFKEKNKTGMRGSQAVYDEFGTGTLGSENPHDRKADYNLNAYNSGRTIRAAKRNINTTSGGQTVNIPKGALYWTYKYNGETIYTQGRPAGMQVYKASKVVRNKIKEICKKRVGEALSKL